MESLGNRRQSLEKSSATRDGMLRAIKSEKEKASASAEGFAQNFGSKSERDSLFGSIRAGKADKLKIEISASVLSTRRAMWAGSDSCSEDDEDEATESWDEKPQPASMQSDENFDAFREDLLISHVAKTLSAIQSYVQELTKANRSDVPPAVVSWLCENLQICASDLSLGVDESVNLLLVATLSKELFSNFQCDSFDNVSTLIPDANTAAAQTARRQRFASLFHVIVQSADEDFTSPDFEQWFQAWKTRVFALWKRGKWPLFTKKSQDALKRIAKLVWSLHKLIRAYPTPPELIRFGAHSMSLQEYCEPFLNGQQGSASARGVVVLTAFPGFLINETVIKCKVHMLC